MNSTSSGATIFNCQRCSKGINGGTYVDGILICSWCLPEYKQPRYLEHGPNINFISAIPDELSYCDPEIQAIFSGTTYQVGAPTQAQLIREIRALISALKGAKT